MSAQYLTPQQLAARWACSPEHVARLCKRGELRAMRLGRVWRIREDAVAAYEARQTQQPESAPEMAPATEAPRRATRVIGLDGWRPENPVFPELWGMDAPARESRSRG